MKRVGMMNCKRTILAGALWCLFSSFFLLHASSSVERNVDSLSFYLDSIRYSDNNFKRTEYVRRGLEYGRKNNDSLAFCMFRFEEACLFLSQGNYLVAFDSLVRLEERVSSILGCNSLLQTGGNGDKTVSTGLLNDSLWKNLHILIGLGLAHSEVYLHELTEAADIIIAIRAKYSTDSLDVVSGRCCNAMGAILSHQGLISQAQEYYFKALEICRDKLPADKLMSIYNNLAVTYTLTDQPDQALKYALYAYGVFRDLEFYGEQYINSIFYIGVAYGELGNNALAEDYLLLSLKEAESRNYEHLALYIRNSLVLFYLDRHQYLPAEKYAKTNVEAARKIKNRMIEETSCLYLAQIYDDRGDCAFSLQYLDTAYKISKLLAVEEQEIRMGYQQRKFLNYQEEQERLQVAQALGLANSKLQNRNLWMAVIALLGLLFFIGMVFLYRRLMVQRKLNRLIRLRLDEAENQNQDQLDHLQEDMQRALTDKDKELTAMALYYVKIQGLMDALDDKLKSLRVLCHLRTKERLCVTEMEALLKSFTPDKNWNEFELYFRRVDTDFFEKLESNFPGLTANERRLCALIRLNLNSKEIATMTSRTFQSVNTAKTRLKQKFGCDKDQSLYDFLAKL